MLEVKLPERAQPKIATHVAERDGVEGPKRVGFGIKEYVGSTRDRPRRGLRPTSDARSVASGGLVAPGSGSRPRREDLVELSSLVNSKTAVTITDSAKWTPIRSISKADPGTATRLQEIKSHSNKHDLDFDSEVESMETKIYETRRMITIISRRGSAQ